MSRQTRSVFTFTHTHTRLCDKEIAELLNVYFYRMYENVSWGFYNNKKNNHIRLKRKYFLTWGNHLWFRSQCSGKDTHSPSVFAEMAPWRLKQWLLAVCWNFFDTDLRKESKGQVSGNVLINLINHHLIRLPERAQKILLSLVYGEYMCKCGTHIFANLTDGWASMKMLPVTDTSLLHKWG